MLQLHGLSPYRFSPDSPALAFLRDADWLKINHREYPAIYPPLTEAVFAALAAMGNAVWLYKLLFMAVDLATIGVLRRLLARCGASRKQAAWYAWNPLAIYSFAGAAHFDGLMILPLVAAVCALQEYESAAAVSRLGKASQDDRHTHLWTSSIFLGLSIATKIAPVALLPVWAFAARSGRRGVGVLAAAIAPLAILAFIYGFPGTPVFTALLRFGDSIRVNDLLWWLVEATLLPDIAHYRGLYAGCTLAACVALAYWFRRDWKRSFLWVWGAALLLSPVVHAWYITWMLPLAAWRGEPARARVRVFHQRIRLFPVVGGQSRQRQAVGGAGLAADSQFSCRRWRRLRGRLLRGREAPDRPLRPAKNIEIERVRVDTCQPYAAPRTPDDPCSGRRRGGSHWCCRPATRRRRSARCSMNCAQCWDPRLGMGCRRRRQRLSLWRRSHGRTCASPSVAAGGRLKLPRKATDSAARRSSTGSNKWAEAPSAYIFFAAEGANDPADLARLLDAYARGSNFVLGCRTGLRQSGNREVMGWSHVVANRLLGAWCGLLTGRWFRDIGPLRPDRTRTFSPPAPARMDVWLDHRGAGGRGAAGRANDGSSRARTPKARGFAKGFEGQLAPDALDWLADRPGWMAHPAPIRRLPRRRRFPFSPRRQPLAAVSPNRRTSVDHLFPLMPLPSLLAKALFPITGYTHWLHTRWPSGTVEHLPEIGPYGETRLHGVRIAGDLTGIPLLEIFSRQRRARRPGHPERAGFHIVRQHGRQCARPRNSRWRRLGDLRGARSKKRPGCASRCSRRRSRSARSSTSRKPSPSTRTRAT